MKEEGRRRQQLKSAKTGGKGCEREGGGRREEGWEVAEPRQNKQDQRGLQLRKAGARMTIYLLRFWISPLPKRRGLDLGESTLWRSVSNGTYKANALAATFIM